MTASSVPITATKFEDERFVAEGMRIDSGLRLGQSGLSLIVRAKKRMPARAPLVYSMNSKISTLLAAPDVDWQAVLDAAISEFNGTTGTLHQLDKVTGMLQIVSHRGIPPQIMPMIQIIPIGKGIAGVAAERREPVELCNLQADLGGVAKPGARATNVQGSLAVPCLSGDQLRGTLGVGMMTPHDFTDEEKGKLMEIGRAVAEKLG
jgi:hypothetical protein